MAQNLKTIEIYFFMVLEARSPKLGCQCQEHPTSGGSREDVSVSFTCSCVSSASASIFADFLPSMCVCTEYSHYKDTSHWNALPELLCICKDSRD